MQSAMDRCNDQMACKKRQNLYIRARKSKDPDVKNHYNYAIQRTLTKGIEGTFLVRELQLLSRSFGHLSINLRKTCLESPHAEKRKGNSYNRFNR